jgi:hypothetical protein
MGVRVLYRSAVASVVLVLLAAGEVAGWSQLNNNFPNNPTSCDNITYLCVAWPVNANGSSVTVWAYLDPSLANAYGENLHTDALNGAAAWNAAPARNPFVRGTDVSTGTTVDVTMYPLDPTGCTWGKTNLFYGSNPHVIASAVIWINLSSMTWNHSYRYDCGSADSRYVVTHELGHLQGLGHTSYSALMHQGGEPFWQPRTNDIQGLQAIYGSA